MSAKRFVVLDPDGTAGVWLHVVVAAPTGVFYQHQYGGTANRHGTVEGYLVPVEGPEALASLRHLFEVELRGAGTWDHTWPERKGEREALRASVGGIRFWSSDGVCEEPHFLQLDESRIREADEAWLPVLTPDGPGILVWNNSD